MSGRGQSGMPERGKITKKSQQQSEEIAHRIRRNRAKAERALKHAEQTDRRKQSFEAI
jgi:hypothetical protein